MYARQLQWRRPSVHFADNSAESDFDPSDLDPSLASVSARRRHQQPYHWQQGGQRSGNKPATWEQDEDIKARMLRPSVVAFAQELVGSVGQEEEEEEEEEEENGTRQLPLRPESSQAPTFAVPVTQGLLSLREELVALQEMVPSPYRAPLDEEA